MTTPIADALVLVLSAAGSLHRWHKAGVLEREWAIYSKLRPLYRSLVLVSHGGPEEVELAARFDLGADVVCNAGRIPPTEFQESLPKQAAAAVADRRDVLVKTNQLTTGDHAVRIVEVLRRQRGAEGCVSLLAGGDRLQSRFAAREFGPNSVPARDTADRERELCRSADAVSGTTREMLDDLAWRHELDPGAMALVPSYVLAEGDYEPTADRETGVILCVAKLTKRKRVDRLIEAVAGLPDTLRTGITLRVVGDGPERPTLESLAKERAIACEFLGQVPNAQVLELMAKCTIYVQASELEGHPKSVLEAMSTGAAVVVANSPGLADVVQNGVTGLHVAGDPATFTHAIGALLADEDWRGILGSAAARMARSSSSLSVVLEHELASHRLALERAGQAFPIRAAAVRWDRSLTWADPAASAERWYRSMLDFQMKLGLAERTRFIAEFTAMNELGFQRGAA